MPVVAGASMVLHPEGDFMKSELDLERLAADILAAYTRASELRQKGAAELLLQALEELAGKVCSCEGTLNEAYFQAIPPEKTARQ